LIGEYAGLVSVTAKKCNIHIRQCDIARKVMPFAGKGSRFARMRLRVLARHVQRFGIRPIPQLLV
jgi:hypothetical protein